MKMANSDEELAFRQKEKEKLGNNLIVLFPLGSCVFVNVRASAHCNAKVLKINVLRPLLMQWFLCPSHLFVFRWAQMGGEFQGATSVMPDGSRCSLGMRVYFVCIRWYQMPKRTWCWGLRRFPATLVDQPSGLLS